MIDSSVPSTYEIRDAAGRAVCVGGTISGDFTILRNGEPAGVLTVVGECMVGGLLSVLQLSAPPAFTFTCSAFGSGDGRGGNARDRRKARRAGRIWRSLGEVVRDQSGRAREELNESMERAVWHGNTHDLWGLSSYPRLRARVDSSATVTNPNAVAIPAITIGIKL